MYLVHGSLALLQDGLIPRSILLVLSYQQPVSERNMTSASSSHADRVHTCFRIFSPSLANDNSSSLISFSLCEKRNRLWASCSCRRKEPW